MAKLESSLKNMVLSLGIISMVAAGLLAGAYILTKDTIEATAEKNRQAAKAEVLNGREGNPVEITVDGFGGKMTVMVGLAADGEVLGYKILAHSETPGLGDKAGMWFKTDKNDQSVIGKIAGSLKVKQDGGDVDAITAATISSRAFLKALNEAADQNVEAASGATVQEHRCCGHCGEGECGHHGEGECGHCEGGCGHHAEMEAEAPAEEHVCPHHEGGCGHCPHHDVEPANVEE